MYNLKDTQRKQAADAVIEKLKDQHAKDQKNEIFEDDDHTGAGKKFNQMRETKTGGFGAKAQYVQEGGLQPEDEDEGDGEDEDEGEEDGVDEEDEESDHNF